MKIPYSAILGYTLSLCRRDTLLSTKDTEVSRETLNNIETGRVRITIDMLRMIARVTKFPAGAMIAHADGLAKRLQDAGHEIVEGPAKTTYDVEYLLAQLNAPSSTETTTT